MPVLPPLPCVNRSHVAFDRILKTSCSLPSPADVIQSLFFKLHGVAMPSRELRPLCLSQRLTWTAQSGGPRLHHRRPTPEPWDRLEPTNSKRLPASSAAKPVSRPDVCLTSQHGPSVPLGRASPYGFPGAPCDRSPELDAPQTHGRVLAANEHRVTARHRQFVTAKVTVAHQSAGEVSGDGPSGATGIRSTPPYILVRSTGLASTPPLSVDARCWPWRSRTISTSRWRVQRRLLASRCVGETTSSLRPSTRSLCRGGLRDDKVIRTSVHLAQAEVPRLGSNCSIALVGIHRVAHAVPQSPPRAAVVAPEHDPGGVLDAQQWSNTSAP